MCRTVNGISRHYASAVSWLGLISFALAIAAISGPIVSLKVFRTLQPDVHFRSPLSESPTFGSSEIIWTLDRRFELYIPEDSTATEISLSLFAPYGGYAKETSVRVTVGETRQIIKVLHAKLLRVVIEPGQALTLDVDRCVVPAEVDPRSPDDRSLCIGIAEIDANPSPFFTRLLKEFFSI